MKSTFYLPNKRVGGGGGRGDCIGEAAVLGWCACVVMNVNQVATEFSGSD